jgi:hypothetical protein
MCDYSLHGVETRPAKVGDRLVSTNFPASSYTRGFAAIEARNVAVCLAPGTEIAFDREVEFKGGFGFWSNPKLNERVARFRQVNPDRPNMHHDALEFPSGEVVLVTRLVEGQTATVLQLPASASRQHGQESRYAPDTISA